MEKYSHLHQTTSSLTAIWVTVSIKLKCVFFFSFSSWNDLTVVFAYISEPIPLCIHCWSSFSSTRQHKPSISYISPSQTGTCQMKLHPVSNAALLTVGSKGTQPRVHLCPYMTGQHSGRWCRITLWSCQSFVPRHPHLANKAASLIWKKGRAGGTLLASGVGADLKWGINNAEYQGRKLSNAHVKAEQAERPKYLQPGLRGYSTSLIRLITQSKWLIWTIWLITFSDCVGGGVHSNNDTTKCKKHAEEEYD